MQSIAGPLCFCGDMVGSDRMLPPIEPGDYVVLHDTGAYYFSNPFYYNALPAPAVYAASRDPGGAMELGVWRQHQTMDDVLAVLG
jgi:diaminopimelate decarboxylase